MSQAEPDTRRKTRILTEDDLQAIKKIIASIVGHDGSGTPAVLLRDLTFSQAVGGIAAGTTFPMGTSHDDIFTQLAKTPVELPTYLSPSLFLSSHVPINPEIGTHLNLTFIPTWVKNDAGNPSIYTLRKNNANMFTGPSPVDYTEPEFMLTGVPVTYQASITHVAGAVKNDSEGNAFPTGRIEAGTVNSNTIVCVGLRYGFYGADTDATIPTTSSEIRSLYGKLPIVENDTTFRIQVPSGARRITFWYPNTCHDVQSVKYLEQGGAEYRDLFVKTTAPVEGANGYSSTPYKGFSWILAVAPASPMTLDVSI